MILPKIFRFGNCSTACTVMDINLRNNTSISGVDKLFSPTAAFRSDFVQGNLLEDKKVFTLICDTTPGGANQKQNSRITHITLNTWRDVVCPPKL